MVNAKKFLAFCSGIVILLSFILSGCSIKAEDYVPETLGAPEGLYLYKGNSRSFTDGSEPADILTEITLGETVYGSDDFEINSAAYMTETHEIFYTVSVDEKCLVWHVNYKTKVSEFLYEFPEGERAYLESNNYYVLAQSNSTGILFDKNTEIISDACADFTLSQDVLYKIDDTTFEFWKDGKTTKVDIRFQPRYYGIFHLGNYFYMFGEEKAVSVSLDSGKTVFFDLTENAKGTVHGLYRTYVLDNALFFVLNGNYNTLWKAENGTFEILHTYSDENCSTHKNDGMRYDETYVVIKDYGQGILNFSYSCCWLRGGESWYHEHRFYYDAASGEVKNGEKSIPKSEPESLTVAGYRFYISKRYYGHPLWGSFAGETGYYYYLNREKAGKKEIMQYKYVSSSDNVTVKFYDDICEF